LDPGIGIFHFPGNFTVLLKLRTMAFKEMDFMCDKNLKKIPLYLNAFF